MRTGSYKGHYDTRRLADTAVVTRPEGDELPLGLDLVNHSPTGFRWGYCGSGPAQLALAILADTIGDERALAIYQRFKERVIAQIYADRWVISIEEVVRIAGVLELGHTPRPCVETRS